MSTPLAIAETPTVPRPAPSDAGEIATISRALAEHAAVLTRLESEKPVIAEIASRIVASLRAGGKVLFMGNGGSAADAQHLAAELMGRFERERRALPALALTTDTSVLTAIANDYSYERVFARQVEALARPGDVVFGISTSGTSGNILSAFEAARARGAVTVGLTGRDGGKMPAACDVCLVVPSERTARIQELHILIGHTVCDLVEEAFAVDEGRRPALRAAPPRRVPAPNPLFARKLRALFGRAVRIADLDGAGGQAFVEACRADGHAAGAVASWGTSLPGAEVFTSWAADDLGPEAIEQLCKSIGGRLDEGGIWIVCAGGERGPWEQALAGAGLCARDDLARYFGDDWLRGPMQGAPGTLVLVVSRAGANTPRAPYVPPYDLAAVVSAGKVVLAEALASRDAGGLRYAAALFGRALEYAPGDPDLTFAYATALVHLGRRDEAQDAIAAVLEKRPDHAGALVLRAQLGAA